MTDYCTDKQTQGHFRDACLPAALTGDEETAMSAIRRIDLDRPARRRQTLTLTPQRGPMR